MALLKQDRVIDDPWRPMDETSPLPPRSPVIVSYARWRRDRDALSKHAGPLGIVLASDQSPALIADNLHLFGLVGLGFPKFTDGRAYSYARLLRDKLGFTGEIRAMGSVLRDQLFFMRRCGFDAFEIPDDADITEWTSAFNDFSVRYQRTVDRMPAVTQLRTGRAIAPAGMVLGPRPDSDPAGSWSY